MTQLAISFQAGHVHTEVASWEKQHKRIAAAANPQSSISIAALQSMRWGCKPYAGGTFVVFDWEEDRVLWQLDVDAPTGFCWKDDLLYLNLLRLNEIAAFDGHGREQRRISHRYMNDLHTIQPTQRGFLLTSTGIDTILEIDHEGHLLYEWCALDHGYNTMRNGQVRVLDRSLDHRYILHPTSSHTTHVNSARFLEPEEHTILATLFHQGAIIAIDRATGRSDMLVSGLNAPHDLRPYENGWIVSNTRGNQTVLLDSNWQIRQRIDLGFNWVLSSVPLPDGSIIIADTNHSRLVRVFPENQRDYEVRAYPPEWHIYLLEHLAPEQERFFIRSETKHL